MGTYLAIDEMTALMMDYKSDDEEESLTSPRPSTSAQDFQAPRRPNHKLPLNHFNYTDIDLSDIDGSDEESNESLGSSDDDGEVTSAASFADNQSLIFNDIPSSSTSNLRPIIRQPAVRRRLPPKPKRNVPQNLYWFRVYPLEEKLDVTNEFIVRNTGPQCPVSQDPRHYIYLFFTKDMWKHFVKETNSFAKRYIHDLCVEGIWSPTSRIARWRNVTVKEMKIFWAIIINMSLSKRKKLESYWANDFVLSQPFYRQAMPLFRFQLILSMFHLSSCVSPPMGQPGYDPWMKVRDFMDMMATNFKTYFVPSQEVCINESKIGMKNRCKFIQNMPNKRHSTFGIKQFELYDSKTAYILNFAFYSGKDFLNNSEEPFTQKVVAHLMRDTGLLGKGYHLFTDNYYSKIPLARFLNHHKTFFTGTVNKNSKELCQTILSTKLPAGNSVYFIKKIDPTLPPNETILFMKYQEKITRKPVQVITTAFNVEDIEIIPKERVAKTKPAVIHKYNQFISRVDVNDKCLYQNTLSQMSMKYWKKIVFNIIDMAIHNAYCLYKSHNACAISKFEFMTNIIYDLSKSKDPASLNLQPVPPLVGQLSTPPNHNIHTLKRIPNNNQKVCIVCSQSGKTKKKARFYCPSCKTGVHPDCYSEMVHHGLLPSPNKKQRLI